MAYAELLPSTRLRDWVECYWSLDVPQGDPALRRLEGWPVTMPVRDTFYGMREIGVEAPGGHLIVFAVRV